MITGLVVLVFSAVYVLIATERINRTVAALVGAGIMVVLGVVDAHGAFFDEHTAIDWNVIFLLLGMMVIVSVLKQTGVFEFLAIWAAKRARGRPFAVMVMLVLITSIASALLDNVTTVLLVAPVTLLVCERMGVRPESFLIAEALASNIAGTSTLVGDPPNIIIASRAGLTFNDFLVHLAPLVVVLLVLFVGLCWLLWGRTLRLDPKRARTIMALDEREAIRDKGLLIKALAVLAAVLLGFVLQGVLGLEPSLTALLGAGALILLSGLPADEYLAEVEWGTLLFFMGLFIMVGALVRVGLIERLGEWLTGSVGHNELLAGSLLLWVSGILSAIVDNIPYVATMSPLVSDLVSSGAGDRSLWWALALGADLGGNATAIGASANVVVLGIAARNRHAISFWEFTKYGLVVAFVTLLVSWGYWVLRYVVM